MAKVIKFEIDIATTGEVTAEAHGFRGKACQERMEQLLCNLGTRKVTRRKPEFVAQTTAGVAAR